ncbi:Eco57I restriction-modification methylase domain-containing protein [Calditrichota bacterium LG25]
MKPYEAKALIRDVFENRFVKEKYKLFIKNLLKDFEEKTFTYTGNTIPRAFDNYIRKLERIGKFEDNEGNVIDILIVELKRDHSIEYARSTQRNFIRWYLAGSRGGQMKDAALVAFHSEKSPDWRFSFIKMQYSLETKKDELTPAKRYSFLVGEKGKSHTAQQQLVRLLKSDDIPLLSDIEEAFNIETVTNEFFEKYRDLTLKLKEQLDKILESDLIVKNEFENKNIQTIDFAKKLMGQIVFIYFLQRKGWLGLQNGQKYGEGDRNFLRTLFNMKKDNENFFNDYLEYLFYEALSQKRVTDFYPRFNCRIPFLNGGLFDPINFYEWEKTDIVIPDELFTNSNKTKEGDIGDGILDVFDRYNFTVKEDEPLDKEVAVDPEMLGKVFERMLDVKERKSKGAFYTPREIVHYMAQESLIHYLDSALNSKTKVYQKLGENQTNMFGNKTAKQTELQIEVTGARVLKEDIETLIKHGEKFLENEEQVLLQGGETHTYKHKIPQSIRKYAKEIDKALEDIRVCDPAVGSGAFPVGVMTEIVKARSILFKIQNPGKEPSHYDFKNHAIHHCLYGVDIDASAVEICKLRLWLSLVVDEQRIDKIEPLPNLDYKIVKGNSLIGMPDNVMRDINLQKEINELMEKYYAETDQSDKRELKQIIDNKIRQLMKSAEQYAGHPIDFDFRLFFHEVFYEKGGFDVVIGNPPYGADIPKDYLKHIKKRLTHTNNSNSAAIFIDFAKNKFINHKGIFTFIVPKSLIYSKRWFSLVKYLSIRTESLLDVERGFENVLLEQVVFVYNSLRSFEKYKTLKFHNGSIKKREEINTNLIKKFEVWLCDVSNKEIYIAEKIRNNTILLSKITKTIRGLPIQKLLHEDGDIKIVGGKNIQRYKIAGIKGFVKKKDLNPFHKKVKNLLSPKILSQNIVAHIENPKPHIKIISAIDYKGEILSLDTVNNTFLLNNTDISLKFLISIFNSELTSWFAYKFIYGSAIRTMHFDNYYIGKIPIPLISRNIQRFFEILIDYILFFKKHPNEDKSFYLQQLIDGMIFELYFEKEIKNAGRDILKYITNLTPITDDMTDKEKMEIINKTFNELYDPNHPVRQNLEGMNEIEEVRIIKGLDQ